MRQRTPLSTRFICPGMSALRTLIPHHRTGVNSDNPTQTEALHFNIVEKDSVDIQILPKLLGIDTWLGLI